MSNRHYRQKRASEEGYDFLGPEFSADVEEVWSEALRFNKLVFGMHAFDRKELGQPKDRIFLRRVAGGKEEATFVWPDGEENYGKPGNDISEALYLLYEDLVNKSAVHDPHSPMNMKPNAGRHFMHAPEQVDWDFEEERAGKMSDDELQYAIKDAREAASTGMPTAGKYIDQMHVYQGELNRRQGRGMKKNGDGMIGTFNLKEDIENAPAKFRSFFATVSSRYGDPILYGEDKNGHLIGLFSYGGPTYDTIVKLADGGYLVSESGDLTKEVLLEEGIWLNAPQGGMRRNGKWTTKYKDSLPDDAFLMPKARKLPYKDRQGRISKPHLRNALARADQVKGVSQRQVDRAVRKGERLLEEHGGYQRNSMRKNLRMKRNASSIDWTSPETLDELTFFFAQRVGIKRSEDPEAYEALREEIEETIDTNGRFGHMGDSISIHADGEEYNLISDIDEAERIAVESVEQDLESEPEIFSPDFISQHLTISDTDRSIIASEDADSLYDDRDDDDIISEYSDKFGDDPEELMDADIDELRDQLKEDHASYVEKELEDPIQYFVHDQGIYSLEDLMKASFISIDTEAAAKEAVDVDGFAHFMSHYDGNYHETDNGIVVMKE